MFRRAFPVGAVLGLLCAPCAHAQSVTYRCVDANGRSTYTNVKEEMTGKKCTVVSREVSVVPAQQFAPQPSKGGNGAAKAAGGERVDASTQRNRDETRRKILQEELDSAEKRLTEARQKLTEQDSSRSAEERAMPQRALERLKPYQEEVGREEQNVASLRRELSNLR
jgi:hypothetical protein